MASAANSEIEKPDELSSLDSPQRTPSLENNEAHDAVRGEKVEEEGTSNLNPIDWDGPDDPLNPRNLSNGRKIVITASLASLVTIVTFNSSVMSPAGADLVKEFGISKEVSILTTALFVLGFAVGPLLFGPASEVLGRKYPLCIGVFLFAIFTIPVAVAKNITTIMVCRFLSGTFGAAPLAIAGGGLADIWDPLSRGIAVAGFAGATFFGPVLGPVVGGFVIMRPSLGWRWTQWISLIFTFFFLIIYAVFCPETYSPVLLARRAKQRGLGAEAEKKRPTMKQLAQLYVLKPFIMVVQEPILALVTLYVGFIFGFLYLCFEAYPVAFEQERGWNIGVGALPFLSNAVGYIVALAIIILHTLTRMKRKLAISGDCPEERLVPMMLGSIILPIGLFWFGWTSDPHINWVPQVISCAFIGCGLLLVFLQGLNYIIDVYKLTANSAISVNAVFRGFLGAGFPMFAPYMFQQLGVPWAMSLIAFLCIAMVPVPFLFFIYGSKVRKWSKFTAY